MNSALLGTSAAVALVLGFGLTATVAAQQAPAPSPARAEPPAAAPQDARAGVTPDGREPRSAGMAREQLTLLDGARVTVLRPVLARGEQAPGREEQAVPTERASPPAWQVAAGGRLWALDPATNELRTCKVHQTSTVGLKVLRCVETSWEVAARAKPRARPAPVPAQAAGRRLAVRADPRRACRPVSPRRSSPAPSGE